MIEMVGQQAPPVWRIVLEAGPDGRPVLRLVDIELGPACKAMLDVIGVVVLHQAQRQQPGLALPGGPTPGLRSGE